MIRSFFTSILLLICSVGTQAQQAKIQFINNSADDSLALIDIYVNGNPVAANLPYHEATAFFIVNVTPQMNFGVSKTGGTINDTFYNLSVTWPPSTTNEYIVVANGIKSPTGYNPKKPFSLTILNNALENTTVNNTAVAFMNGSTDASAPMDFRSGVTTFADLGYSQFSSGYAVLPTNDFTLRITNALGSKTINNYNVPIGTSIGYANKATLILSSGFVTPANNKNGAPFGLWMVPPGGGTLVPLTTTVPEALARVQLIHNSADTSIDSVDVYIDGIKTADNLPFRNAARFEDAWAKVPVNIVICKQNSTAVTDDTLTYATVAFDSAHAYTIVMDGLDTPTTAYTPIKPLSLTSYNNARESATNAANTDVLFMNGSTDVPSLTINMSGTPLATSLAYDAFAPNYYSTVTTDIVLEAVGSTSISKYSAQLQTLGLQGEAVTILSSGFLDTLHNRHGPAFGLYMTKPGGGALTKLPVNTSITKLDKNNALAIWPNPVNNTLHLEGNILFNKAEATIYDISGRIVLHLSNVTSKQVDVSTLENGSYIIRLNDGANPVYSHFIKN
jgi:hypothetical protein